MNATTTAPSNPVRASTLTRDPWSIVFRVLLAIAALVVLFLVYDRVVGRMRLERAQEQRASKLASGIRSGTLGDPARPVRPGRAVFRLRAPESGLDVVVVEGSTPELLQGGPGHYPASVQPGEFGNSVVLGHARLDGAPFAALRSVREGDEITAVTGQGVFRYEVTDVRKVRPGQRDVVGPTLSPQLTLATSASMTSAERLAVIAELKGASLGVPTRPPAVASPDELGTVGDHDRLMAVVLALELLAGIALLGWFAWRRLPPAIAHLLVTPALLVVTWIIFSNLDQVLPGTS